MDQEWIVLWIVVGCGLWGLWRIVRRLRGEHRRNGACGCECPPGSRPCAGCPHTAHKKTPEPNHSPE